jgi:uncharacterized protein YqeY
MSALKDQITEDMKTAMRAKDSERLGTIRLLLAALKQKEVDERVVLDDAAVIAIVDKLIKQRKDSLEAFTKAERKDLADKEAAELVVLQAYLPARLSADEVAAAVKGHRDRAGRQRPRRHGQGHGCGQGQAGGQGRHGPCRFSAAVKAALAG